MPGRLINADTFIRNLCFSCKTGDGEGACAELCPAIAALDKTPTAVVRCYECTEAERGIVKASDGLYCGVWDTVVRYDGYCDHGKRRDGEYFF